ncbi:hypothetical protein CcaverHIS002_0504430 [Cutaneotrichosporon cavernicola]|uniref:Uncharacterized protein n=1 Tax=Cutaneotrichosporon cavernicola TaxID=279322 RepID=A0AA48L6G5_9TREE|nr:uncharacterized protein CcaverHIS019_0504970 [Cutaneotrichosporon cavernicola]BEI85042.1 hypothetical protein CcaverHIS002_0504430 [Cutaneotrichosporon cavernicola]BEI92869.1 hypothetical protein CcaverHIS019_0504970 [Cutaneotrichosporon cavernicola]BEJ00645.1 hypothetical protein CcaverHIS631_0505020 [Cutaneotrichosporon cavernicola]BEJ08410.1 hypothetical protein CcaverHIS641_0504950 [Cutaneotrichosporon cavernicola]
MSVARGYTRIALGKVSNPPILPIPGVRAGNNVPFSLKKTRRNWKPNTARFTWPVGVVAGAMNRVMAARQTLEADPAAKVATRDLYPRLNKIKMTRQQSREVLKAGGLEGMLLSRPSKHFTHQGRALRNEMFEKLHELRRSLDSNQQS